MSNQWLRLWHDMPTDPKWRTVAKASGQRIGDVMAVYIHLLVCASNATERGRTQSFNCEDVGSALDLETEQVVKIVDAMQGRVLEGDRLKGWDKRQVAREDGAAERAKAWREQQKALKQAQESDTERDRTQTERNRTPDTDTEKKEKEAKASSSAGPTIPCPYDSIISAYHEALPSLPRVMLKTQSRQKAMRVFWGWVLNSRKSDGGLRATNADEALAWIHSYFARATDNDFLMGRTGKSDGHENWTCDFDFLLTERGKKHVIEKTRVAA